MGGKKKKNNAVVDAVKETNEADKNKANQKKQQVQVQGPQADPVKQTAEPEPYNQQSKNSQVGEKKLNQTEAPSQSVTLTTETTEIKQQLVKQQSEQINQQEPLKTESQIQNINQTAAQKQEQQQKNEEVQHNTKLEQIKTEVPQTVEEKIQENVQIKTESLNIPSQEVKQQKQDQNKEVPTQAKPQEQIKESNQQPIITQVQQTQQVLIQEAPKQPQVQTNANQVEANNQAQQVEPLNTDLLDGLKYVGMAAEEIIYHNPLQHEAQAHGQPSFTENFQPAAFHLTQRLQQEKLAGTPPKEELIIKQQSGLLQVEKDREEGLEQIRRSAESIDPDPLQFQQQIHDTNKVNILSSYHSQSQQDKNRKLQVQPSIEIKKSDHIIPLAPVTNPTYSNPLPTPQPEKQEPEISEPAKQAKQIDFDKINQKMLKERQVQWKKLQEKELQPKRAMFVKASKPNAAAPVESVEPNRPQKLLYTNNLPLIDKQRTIQEHQKIKKQESEIKQKLTESQKLKKEVNNDNPLKKLTVSALVTAACLGACVLGKADKKITAGLSIASLIVSYIAQK